jgi:hypothetical protein
MLRIQLDLAAAFPHADLNYAGGALHSTNDRPAVVLRPAIGGAAFWFQGRYLRSIKTYWNGHTHSGAARYSASPDEVIVGENDESRWYDRGDLHRDFGPAVRSQHYWYKYDRGVMAASGANTFSVLESGWSTGAPCASGARCPALAARDALARNWSRA